MCQMILTNPLTDLIVFFFKFSLIFAILYTCCMVVYFTNFQLSLNSYHCIRYLLQLNRCVNDFDQSFDLIMFFIFSEQRWKTAPVFMQLF